VPVVERPNRAHRDLDAALRACKSFALSRRVVDSG
jgi:hypothetical protein